MQRVTGPHDLGGLLNPKLAGGDFEAVDISDKKWKFWERQCHGVVWLLVQKGLMSLDELRRATEALPGYASMDYYTKWAAASAAIAIERGTFTKQEWEDQLGPDAAKMDNTVKYHEGDLVRVKPENSSVRWRRPHLRTPGYIFGLIGRIERPCVGLFGDPELKAFREEGPKQPLYRVRFQQTHVWELYQGDPADTIDVEVYQPWLEAATPQQLEQQQQNSTAVRQQQQQQAGQSHCQPHADHHEHGHGHHHGHGHGHHHHDGEEGHDHVHEERSQVEQSAVELEGDESSRPHTAEALQALLINKGVITPQELRREVELMDSRGMKQEGPRLVVRAWTDDAFKQRLLQDTAAAAAELGISTSNFSPAAAAKADPAAGPPTDTSGPGSTAATAAGGTAATAAAGGVPVRSGTVLTAVENSASVHNLVVCTLCSCYPISVLGMSPHWYRSRAYRARAVRDPRGLLAEFGTVLPEGTAIRVHDSTADLRYIVIPACPAGTEGWSEEQLMALVTRDSMIGVAPALSPEQAPGTA